jgi:hypothetical protein
MINFHHFSWAFLALIPQLLSSQVISFDYGHGTLLAARSEYLVTFLVFNNELEGAVRAAQNLAWGPSRVLGMDGPLVQNRTVGADHNDVIIVGTIGASHVIDRLVNGRKGNLRKAHSSSSKFYALVFELLLRLKV